MKQTIFFQEADDDVVGDIQKGCFGVLADLLKLTAVSSAILLLGLHLI